MLQGTDVLPRTLISRVGIDPTVAESATVQTVELSPAMFPGVSTELAVLLSEMGVASAVFLLPTVFMGATFSFLVQAARRAEGGVGQAAALNTFGGALASVLFGVFFLPLIVSKWTLVLISL